VKTRGKGREIKKRAEKGRGNKNKGENEGERKGNKKTSRKREGQ
jgi:hypothetical protein